MSYEVIHRSEMVTCSPLGQNVLSTKKTVRMTKTVTSKHIKVLTAV